VVTAAPAVTGASDFQKQCGPSVGISPHNYNGSMLPKPTAIFFDVGNTLLFPNRDVILAPLYDRGVVPTIEQWHSIERKTKKEFDSQMRTGTVDHGFWHLFYSHLLTELGIHDDALRNQLTDTTRISANWCVIPDGTREILDRIGKQYQIGVISNADGKIADVLATCGIADCFRTITDSGLVGYEKPHPAIFEAALRELGARPEESLYVGDGYSVDYVGATNAGMQAMLLDVSGTYRDSDYARVASLAELEENLQ
jgi:HAD superfamily hydrolase (TIGR01509 family)